MVIVLKSGEQITNVTRAYEYFDFHEGSDNIAHLEISLSDGDVTDLIDLLENGDVSEMTITNRVGDTRIFKDYSQYSIKNSVEPDMASLNIEFTKTNI